MTKKKFSKIRFRKRLDTAWSLAVKNRAGHSCEVCGKQESLNSHHIVGRRNLRLRWEVFNGVCLCAGCHMFKTNSAHQNPIWFNAWLEAYRSEDLQRIYSTMNEIKKWTEEGMRDKLLSMQND